jgi:diacylglycerol kinase family enzyme
MQVTLIHNPAAGDDKRPSRPELESMIREAGHALRYQSVDARGWANALEQPADVIAVAGGDGTVGKVARRVIGRRIPIAVVPIGTANNISRTLGIAGRSARQLIASWSVARRVSWDAGIARGPWGERAFIEGVGAGLFPTSIPHIDADATVARLTAADAKLVYTLQLLREHLDRYPPTRLHVKLDGKVAWGDYILFETLLMAYIGPTLHLAPSTVRGDGLFHVVMISEANRAALHDHLQTRQYGILRPPEFETIRAQRVEIEWTGFPVHIDDRIWPANGEPMPQPPAPIDLRVVRNAVDFLVPTAM